MRKATALLTLLAWVAPAALADDGNIAREGYYPGVVTIHGNILGRSDYLVVSVTGGAFTDLGPAYADALGGADLIYDPAGTLGASIPGHYIVFVDTTDNWWGDGWDVGADEAALMAFLDTNGRLLFVGQDYIYFRGSYTGFPMNYLGVAGVIEDLAANDWILEWTGTPGGALAGQAQSVPVCFAANGFYTDLIVPDYHGLVMWSSPSQPTPVEGGSEVFARAIFSTVEFGCGDLGPVIQGIMAHLWSCSPVEDTSWGRIKGMYR